MFRVCWKAIKDTNALIGLQLSSGSRSYWLNKPLTSGPHAFRLSDVGTLPPGVTAADVKSIKLTLQLDRTGVLHREDCMCTPTLNSEFAPQPKLPPPATAGSGSGGSSSSGGGSGGSGSSGEGSKGGKPAGKAADRPDSKREPEPPRDDLTPRVRRSGKIQLETLEQRKLREQKQADRRESRRERKEAALEAKSKKKVARRSSRKRRSRRSAPMTMVRFQICLPSSGCALLLIHFQTTSLLVRRAKKPLRAMTAATRVATTEMRLRTLLNRLNRAMSLSRSRPRSLRRW
jgi:hypothetical protein